MTDAHYHLGGYETYLAAAGRDYRFHGLHPWQAREVAFDRAALEGALAADAHAGVGEIGLDRLREREIPPAQRALFVAQLEVAAAMGRPVQLHGAKCWGEVVKACEPFAPAIPAFLFHGFSRSGGLLPRIYALGGYVSVGPAILNDHALNYRELVRAIAPERLLVESDTRKDGVTAEAVARRLAEVRGEDAEALFARLEANALAFLGGLA